jgi:ribosome biogenesis GTPase
MQLKARLDGAVAMLVGNPAWASRRLTNALAPESSRPTRTISESTGEGRHTTVSTALFRFPAAASSSIRPGCATTPHRPWKIHRCSSAGRKFLRSPRSAAFNNCLHLREPGCAVTAAAAANRIPPRRYESYKRLINIIRGLPPEHERRR